MHPPATPSTDPAAPRTILVLGPTGGGKTALAIELALRVPGGGECVSADSMQVYRGMDIGTAKPSEDERRGVPHHMIDVADPFGGPFTVADWLDGARDAIQSIHARGKHAIVVGGTNLYAKALVEGMFEGPAGDPAVRARLEALPTEMLRLDLEHHDPLAASRIHPNDRRRTVRALEVWMTTGRRISDMQRQWQDAPRELPPGWSLAGLEWSVDSINRRINLRVQEMLARGFIKEVIRLVTSGTLNRQAMEAVGYHEAVMHLAGRMPIEEVEAQMKIRSRQYAKQQRTWLRRFKATPGSVWIDAETTGTEAAAARVIEIIFPARR